MAPGASSQAAASGVAQAWGSLCHTRPVSRPRHLFACLIVLGVLALVTPAASLAACGGGGSAGDQQYVDPLAHCHRGSSGSSSPSATTPVASTPATTTPTTPVTPAASTATTTSPTATTAAGSGTKGGTKVGAALPYTGLDARLIVGLGLALVLGGFVLRRATRDRRRRFYIR